MALTALCEKGVKNGVTNLRYRAAKLFWSVIGTLRLVRILIPWNEPNSDVVCHMMNS